MNRMLIFAESISYFIGGGVAVYVAVHLVIPALERGVNLPSVFGWWISSGLIVIALFFAAFVSVRNRNNVKTLQEMLRALRIQRMNRIDFLLTLGGLVGVIILTGLVITVFDRAFGINLLSQDSYASFLRMERLEPHEYWLFLVWLPYFFFNIAGEELLWRGYLLPRQIEVVGKYAWVFNGVLWAIFHTAIGWRIAVVLLPIEFIVPYVVQKSGNTWVGIIIHGLYNGNGFILVALGIVS